MKCNKEVFKTKHFVVIKKSNSYFAIEDLSGEEISSSKSYSNAIKKIKLIEKVYNIGYEYGIDACSY